MGEYYSNVFLADCVLNGWRSEVAGGSRGEAGEQDQTDLHRRLKSAAGSR